MFFVLFGKSYKATTRTPTTRQVCCEKCGSRFSYTYLAKAVGEDGSLYFLDNEGAAARAVARAKSELKGELAHGTYMVPCPECGWYQKDMVREMRASRPLSILTGVWIAILGLSVFCAIVIYDRFGVLEITFASVLLLSGLLLVMLRTYNPNWRRPNSRRNRAQRYWRHAPKLASSGAAQESSLTLQSSIEFEQICPLIYLL